MTAALEATTTAAILTRIEMMTTQWGIGIQADDHPWNLGLDAVYAKWESSPSCITKGRIVIVITTISIAPSVASHF